MRGGMKGDYPTHIEFGVLAYTANIVLNSTEWLVSLILFFLSTFYVEFENLELSFGVLTLLADKDNKQYWNGARNHNDYEEIKF